MSWLYVPGSADSSSACDSPFPRHEPSATSNGKPITQRSWLRVWRAVSWTKRLSGVTSPHSTAARGAASWIASLRDSRASPPASPESNADKRTSDGSGQVLPGSFATFDRDSSFWRTFQESLLTRSLAKFSARWPKAGSLRNGTCSARPPAEHRISGGESSFLPTPVGASGRNRSLGPNAKIRPSLQMMASQGLWPTPKASRRGDCPSERRRRSPDLESAVKKWPTPRASDGSKGGSPTNDDLPNAVRFPTPTARDWKSTSSNITRNSRPLSEVVGRVPTPTANRRTGLQSHGRNVVTGQLNPTWVEWLMGLPFGWTALEPLEIASYRQWRREHS